MPSTTSSLLRRLPPLPTASALERVMACSASHVLPAIYDSSAYADRGVAIARFIRAVLGGAPVDAALTAIPDPAWRDTCKHLQWQKVVGDLSHVRGEVAYALDVETDEVAELGQNIGRAYPALGPNQIAGSDDIEGVRLDDVPVVADVKTGHLEVTACEENAQIRFFCRVRQLLLNAPIVEGRILYVREDGFVRPDCHEFGAFDLESFQDDLRTMVRRVAEARLQYANGEALPVSSGDHCRYCPGKASCPRYTALARAMLPDLTNVAARLASMSPEDQGRAVVLAKDCERLLGAVLDALKELAHSAPIPLPNGKTFKVTEYERNDFSRERAVAALRERGATDEDIAKLYVASTVESVKVVGRAAKKGRAA